MLSFLLFKGYLHLPDYFLSMKNRMIQRFS
jgi:hypothetical protein